MVRAAAGHRRDFSTSLWGVTELHLNSVANGAGGTLAGHEIKCCSGSYRLFAFLPSSLQSLSVCFQVCMPALSFQFCTHCIAPSCVVVEWQVTDPNTGLRSLGNSAVFSFRLPQRPAAQETLTISCSASDVVTLIPTTVSFTAQQFDELDGVSANFTVTAKPYYGNDWSTAGSRSYSIVCSAASSVAAGSGGWSGGGISGGVYGGNASVQVHNVEGTILNSIYPTWQVVSDDVIMVVCGGVLRVICDLNVRISCGTV